MIGSQSMHYYIDYYTLAYHYTHDTGTCLGPTAKPNRLLFITLATNTKTKSN